MLTMSVVPRGGKKLDLLAVLSIGVPGKGLPDVTKSAPGDSNCGLVSYLSLLTVL